MYYRWLAQSPYSISTVEESEEISPILSAQIMQTCSYMRAYIAVVEALSDVGKAVGMNESGRALRLVIFVS